MRGTITSRLLKNGKKSWGYVFDAGRDEAGKRRQIVHKGFESKKAAEKALAAAIEKQSRALKKDAIEFGPFFKDWLAQYGASHWGRMTAEQNNKRAAYAIRMFGDVQLQKLDSMRLEKDLCTLLAKGGRKTPEYPEGKPLSPKTVREIAALVSQALDKAVDWNKIDRNPMAKVDRPTAHKIEVEIPEPEEFEKFLDEVKNTRYYAMSVFAAASGCRRGEMLALTWSDVDFKTGVVMVSKSVSDTKAGLEIKVTKSRKTRYVRVSKTTLQVLREHKKQLDHDQSLFGSDYQSNDLVFPTPDGSYYSPDRVTNRISEFMQKCGINASLHSLRHLHASLMLSKHVPITVISKRLGHANSQITLDIYSHALKGDEAAAADIWDEATADIIGRTQKPAQKDRVSGADVIFCYPKSGKSAVNG